MEGKDLRLSKTLVTVELLTGDCTQNRGQGKFLPPARHDCRHNGIWPTRQKGSCKFELTVLSGPPDLRNQESPVFHAKNVPTRSAKRPPDKRALRVRIDCAPPASLGHSLSGQPSPGSTEFAGRNPPNAPEVGT